MGIVCAVSVLLTQTRPSHAQDNAPAGNPAAGALLFERNCAVCHGIEGKGGRGPSLHRPVLARATTAEEIAGLITNGIPPEMPDSSFLGDAPLADLAAYVYSLGRLPSVPAPGDPVKGRRLFEQSGCMSCHIVKGEGNGYGPELTGIGVVRGTERLRQTLIDPRSTIPREFQFIEVVTPTGQKVRGVRRNEDTLSIQLQDAAGTFYSFQKSQLHAFARLRGETPMPSFKALSKNQLDDLVAYLAQLGQSP